MSQINDRKLEHIEIVRKKKVEPLPSSFDSYRLPYSALPDIDLKKINTSTKMLDWKLSFPFMISSMTGGPHAAKVINQNLAIAAETCKVPLALGSMRVTLRKPESIKSFFVKHLCPSIPLFANLGLVQLNYGCGADEINKIIDCINADGIFLHINPLQEAIQPEGDTNFKDLLKKLEKIVPKVTKPILIKEVGNGLSRDNVQNLKDIGIAWIDVAGMGGTNWPWIEGYRRQDDLGELFNDLGIPTAQCIEESANIKDVNLIAGGGIRNGKHIAIAIALGAKLTAAAKPLLEAALESPEACVNIINKFKQELEIAMFATGSGNIEELRKLDVVRKINMSP